MRLEGVSGGSNNLRRQRIVSHPSIPIGRSLGIFSKIAVTIESRTIKDTARIEFYKGKPGIRIIPREAAPRESRIIRRNKSKSRCSQRYGNLWEDLVGTIVLHPPHGCPDVELANQEIIYKLVQELRRRTTD